jgi:hypothetical protein
MSSLPLLSTGAALLRRRSQSGPRIYDYADRDQRPGADQHRCGCCGKQRDGRVAQAAPLARIGQA